MTRPAPRTRSALKGSKRVLKKAVIKHLDAMLVIHDRRPKEKKSPRGDSQSSALTKPP
eukprot:COSAG01_NODE_16154_length_1265_cov_1.325043_2_plen_57_part_01